jgi:hypothetical protein
LDGTSLPVAAGSERQVTARKETLT